MRLQFKRFPFLFEVCMMKLRKSYGIKSSENILLFDCDSIEAYDEAWHWFKSRYGSQIIVMYATVHGFHVIVCDKRRRSLTEQAVELVSCPYADRRWVAIGLKRGYWFLESAFPLPRGQYMEIERNADT